MTTAHQSSADAAERIADEIQRAKDNIAHSAATAGEDLAAELRRLRDDIAAMKATIGTFGKTSGAEAGRAASHIGAAAAEAAGEFAGNAKQEAQSVFAGFEKFARQNPQCVICGAVGLGFVLSFLLRRR